MELASVPEDREVWADLLSCCHHSPTSRNEDETVNDGVPHSGPI